MAVRARGLALREQTVLDLLALDRERDLEARRGGGAGRHRLGGDLARVAALDGHLQVQSLEFRLRPRDVQADDARHDAVQ